MLSRFLLIISVIINYNIHAQDDRRDFDAELNYQSGAIDKVKKEIEDTRRKIKSQKQKEVDYQEKKGSKHQNGLPRAITAKEDINRHL